jgi:hypothetical protein
MTSNISLFKIPTPVAALCHVRTDHRRPLLPSIVTRLRDGWPGFASRQGQGLFFSSPPLCPDRLWGPPSLLSIWYRFFSQGVKQPKPEANHSPPSTAEVKNAWSNTATPPYFFMAWHFIKHRDINLTFTFIYCVGRGLRCADHQSKESLIVPWQLIFRNWNSLCLFTSELFYFPNIFISHASEDSHIGHHLFGV